MDDLTIIVYPDNTAVNYAYDANNSLVSVTDWANRVTSYTYDVNNMLVGVTKPDGSVTATVYDNTGRITSTVEKTASGTVITGFEYTYDNLSRIVEEKHLANSTKICYTYDNLSRVTSRTVKNAVEAVLSRSPELDWQELEPDEWEELTKIAERVKENLPNIRIVPDGKEF